VVICWPRGVRCVVFEFYAFLPLACNGIQVLVTIEVWSLLCIEILDVFSVLLPYMKVFARMAVWDWCHWCYACMNFM
jgi:hypothetical protein